ncbi:MAG: tRNA (N(6)-L-threonylcarbamoyladenosine(37)-C(2))-methylthiotransferase MtaB [Lachnospiraceae bacterium]|nr:tRNA (N(6)-L-threonylcarbamoyladenosine(37)-C(2))-methylthiotransferase MtaB [Lachnospiraceae bacterium]
MKKRASLHNLGCKVNAYETDVMAELLSSAGYEIVPFGEPADVVIINTCSVTNIADRKSRQMLHRARKQNPQALIVAAGCYVQTGGKDPDADICLGNNKKGELLRALEEKLDIVIDLKEGCGYEDMQLSRPAEHTRAFIKIQDGCNQFCSYCIIPFARGRVRSRRPSEILAEARKMASAGVKELVLTGIHISSYGYDLLYPEKRPMANAFAEEELLKLLSELDAIPGIERLRLSSLEPRIITPGFAEGLKGIPSLCPHFHLSLQSGSDAVLKRMNRHYDTADYARRVELLRKSFDDPAITTDIIVGFPGETEAEFKESLEFAERMGFYEMHIFKYSRRRGTVADRLPGQLSEAQKAERSDALEEVEKRMTADYRLRHIGKRGEVLCEEEKLINGTRYMTGHTREYLKLALQDSAALPGELCEVTIGEALSEDFLRGIE